MGLRETLRKLRRSQGPEGYSQYKHERDHAREQEGDIARADQKDIEPDR